MRAINQTFFDIDTDELVESYRSDAQGLETAGFQAALELFQEAAVRVPAYKDFLKRHELDPKLIKTPEDFSRIPVTNKQNYVRHYPLNELCWDGELDDSYIIASSSGSTGEPFLWPRGETQEHSGAVSYEIILKHIFEVDKHRTLFVINYAMGTWIAGPFALARSVLLARKGYPLAAVTPGTDIQVSLGLIKKMGPAFDQIIIAGYPPLVKDLLDAGEKESVDWSQYRIRFLLSAEGFSEKFRDYIHEKVGLEDELRGSVNIYASADAGTHAHETPLSTQIRRLIADDPASLQAIFGDTRLPTLAQYDPRTKHIEAQADGSLLFTTRAGIPLIRYSIGDNGGIYSFSDMNSKLTALGYDVSSILGPEHEQYLWKLPFVYVFGRKDFTVSLHGALIYPEQIKYGLERAGLATDITGRFVVSTEFTRKQDPYLLVRVELAAGKKASAALGKKLAAAIAAGLQATNTEYAHVQSIVGDRAMPKIELVTNGDERYFKRAGKQRWSVR